MIRGVEVNGAGESAGGVSYDDLEIDEDDDGVDETDEDYNEITETVDSVVVPGTPVIASVTSLRRDSAGSQSSQDSPRQQKAKKSFKPAADKLVPSLTPLDSQQAVRVAKRPLETLSPAEPVKKAKLDPSPRPVPAPQPSPRPAPSPARPVPAPSASPGPISPAKKTVPGVPGSGLCHCTAAPIRPGNLGPQYNCQVTRASLAVHCSAGPGGGAGGREQGGLQEQGDQDRAGGGEPGRGPRRPVRAPPVPPRRPRLLPALRRVLLPRPGLCCGPLRCAVTCCRFTCVAAAGTASPTCSTAPATRPCRGRSAAVPTAAPAALRSPSSSRSPWPRPHSASCRYSPARCSVH